MANIGSNINNILTEKGIQQKDLAFEAGVSEAFISYIIAGKKTPSLAVLKRIADYLEVTIDKLLK